MAFIYEHGGEKKMDLEKDSAEARKNEPGLFRILLGGKPDNPSDPAANRRVPISSRFLTGEPKWRYFVLPLLFGAFVFAIRPWQWQRPGGRKSEGK
ncbi:hypothetical protein niasHT_007270 [Heterodera trifolii]|uniref:Uncharacterized protein n=1 Tax=Heterodera trifolii TaxID=157864 RepID=A0ABD2LL49_9BILA